MVDTIKFSEMADGGNLENNQKTPGLLSGANVLFNNPWTFLPPGTTAQRPTPAADMYFRLRFNTDDQTYEFYDSVLGAWTQLQDSQFTAGPFITYSADISLPDAQNLALLANGLLKQTIALGEATLDIAALNTDYYGPGMNPLPVDEGGTQLSSVTAYGLIAGGTTSTGPLQSLTLGSAGEVLQSQGAGALADWATLTPGGGISIANAAGTITISAATGGFATETIVGTTQAAVVNTRYIVGDAAQTTITLPATFAEGDVVVIKGLGAAGWILAANAGDTIQMGSSATSSGGSLTSANQYDTVQVSGLVADTTWSVDYALSSGLTVA